MSALLIDTETTGLVDPQPVEVGIARLALKQAIPVLDEIAVSRFKPSKKISLGALATHHILDEELDGCPPSTSFLLPPDVGYLIGYNVDFDWNVIGRPDVKRIDVCAMCRNLWPEADSHSQGAMLYLLEPPAAAREMLRNAHSAAGDIVVCATILEHVLAKAGPFPTLETLWEFSERARVPKVMTFGKHKGTPIADVPTDYKRWLLKQPDVDPYLAQALRA